MATYIQGVTDYIPQYQPFQPDFNFFAGVIQKKQQQYDQNWSKLNSVYGKFLNAPLTREDNIKNRDQYFKQSVAAIQKITSMDLSLDQNVQQALQVFSPLYNDKSLIHDMSYTKKAMENFSKLDSLKSCVGDKCPGKYWNEGQLFIQYKLDEYKRASADEALNMSAPDAVPMIDVMQRATDLAKEFKPVVQETSQGMYIVTRKNGQLVQVPLYEHFKALIGEDPAVKRMYAVGAYVERENFIREAEAKGVSREEANQIYARDKYEKYQLLVDDSKKMAETQGASLQNQLDRVNEFLKSVPNINENHPLVQTKQNLEQQIQVNEVNRRSVTDIANSINNGYATTTPSGLSSTPTSPQYTPQGADAIVAFYKMNRDFMDAAIHNSSMGAEVKIKADPVALARMREAGANARAEMRERGAWNRLIKEQEFKEKEKTEEALRLSQLQSGTKDIKADFLDEDQPTLPYSRLVTKIEQDVQKQKTDAITGLTDYLTEVATSNASEASIAKAMLDSIAGDITANDFRSRFDDPLNLTTRLPKDLDRSPKKLPIKNLSTIVSIIDPLKPGNEGLLRTAFGQTLNNYVEAIRNTEKAIASDKIELTKAYEFNKRVLDGVLRNYEEENENWVDDLARSTEGLKYDINPAYKGLSYLTKGLAWMFGSSDEDKAAAGVKSEMLKTSLLDPDGGLRSPGEIATSLNAKYGKDITIEVDQGFMQAKIPSGLGSIPSLGRIARNVLSGINTIETKTVMRNGRLVEVRLSGDKVGFAPIFGGGEDGINPTRVYYQGKLIFEGKTNLSPDVDEDGRSIYTKGIEGRRNPADSKNKKQFFESIGAQAFDAMNKVAAQMVSDPQIGLKINPSSPMTAGLGVFATGKDGKLSVNNFKIQGDYGQTPINMSFFGAYQTDIQPILTQVDQELKGAPKISIGYNPNKLANNTEVEVINTIVRELYEESTDPKSNKSFELSPLVQIGGNVNKRGYWFNNVPFDIVNGVVGQYTTNDDEAKSLKEKIVNNGFVIYGDANNFQSSLFNTYDVDPRYNLFLSNKDDKGRFSYQEKNRRGDAELNISFDPVMQAYTGTVDYKRFDPLGNVYRNTSISVPIDYDVVQNGASFSQLLNQFDAIMADVTSTNIKNILSPELADSE